MFSRLYLKRLCEGNYRKKLSFLISITQFFYGYLQPIKKGGRVAEGARLESVFRAT